MEKTWSAEKNRTTDNNYVGRKKGEKAKTGGSTQNRMMC